MLPLLQLSADFVKITKCILRDEICWKRVSENSVWWEDQEMRGIEIVLLALLTEGKLSLVRS